MLCLCEEFTIVVMQFQGKVVLVIKVSLWHWHGLVWLLVMSGKGVLHVAEWLHTSALFSYFFFLVWCWSTSERFV